MKKGLMVSILSAGILMLSEIVLPSLASAQDAYEKITALAEEDCKKIAVQLGEKDQLGVDNGRSFFRGGDWNDRACGWGTPTERKEYYSQLIEDVKIITSHVRFSRYSSAKMAQDDISARMEANSKAVKDFAKSGVLTVSRDTSDGYIFIMRDSMSALNNFQITRSVDVSIVRGSCSMSVGTMSFLFDPKSVYHFYDGKKYKDVDIHPGFNHDRETEMLALARTKAIELLNVLDCGNDISSSSDTTPSVGNSFSKSNSLNKSNYTQALVIEPPKESDFKKVKPSDFEIIYPQNVPSSKLATRSANITGSIFMGKVGGDGQISIDMPHGETATLSGDLTAFDGEISIWRLVRGADKPLQSPRLLEISIYEQDCHFAMQQTNQAAKASDWSGNNVITKTVGDCSYINEDGSVRVLSEQGNIALKTPAELSMSAGKADFGVSYDISTGKSIAEIYNGSVKITNKSGQSKTISTVYGSDIKRIETDKDGAMTEKIAIPLSEWEAFSTSQQEKEKEANAGSNLAIVSTVVILGMGGLIFLLYRTGKLIPLYKTLSQKVSGMTKKINNTGKEEENN